MILFLSGVGTVLGLLAMLGAGYLLGKKNTPKAMTRPPTETQEQEERRRKFEAIQKDMIQILQYDENKAYERKKVY